MVTSSEKKDIPFRYFTEPELAQFFQAIPKEKTRDLVLFLTLLGTGKRISEVLSLKRKDIDFVNRSLRIVTLKKRKKTEQVIRLHQDLAYWLSIYTGAMKAEDDVFPLTRQYADDLIKKYCEQAMIPLDKAHCHTFRHTFAVRWLEQGKPIHKLKRHLNHSHINTTMTYLKVVDQDLNETVDSLDLLGFLK
jgi:integrase/recombinase XerD